MLHEAPELSRCVLRARPAAQRPLGAAFGVTLPHAACRAAVAGDRAALWLGPDEWLLLADAATDIPGALAGATDAAHSLVDVSHRQLGLILEGPHARDVLAADCPLDLEDAFPVGMCTRTVLAKAEIVLWRRAETRWHVDVWRSFAPYVRGRLAEAAREFLP